MENVDSFAFKITLGLCLLITRSTGFAWKEVEELLENEAEEDEELVNEPVETTSFNRASKKRLLYSFRYVAKPS